jgi:hypothetical protein
VTTLGELLDSFHQSAWRLEARDNYDMTDEREQFEEFMREGTSTPSEEDLAYQVWVRSVRASNRTIGRVRLIGRPITDYTRFEMDYYPDLVTAGEEVRILDRAKIAGRSGPWNRDFWVIDSAHVAVMHYNTAGEFLGVQMVEDGDAEPYLAVREIALELSVSLSDYRWPEEKTRVA